MSDTIWTPLLLDAVPVPVFDAVDGLRKTTGRGMGGVRGGIRVGEVKTGNVLDRAMLLAVNGLVPDEAFRVSFWPECMLICLEICLGVLVTGDGSSGDNSES
jgi:hypothetical protein